MSTGCFHETRHDTREHPGRKAQAPPVWKALALSPMLGELQFAIELPQVDAGSQGGARHSPPALAEAWLHVRQALGGDLAGKFLEVLRAGFAKLGLPAGTRQHKCVVQPCSDMQTAARLSVWLGGEAGICITVVAGMTSLAVLPRPSVGLLQEGAYGSTGNTARSSLSGF